MRRSGKARVLTRLAVLLAIGGCALTAGRTLPSAERLAAAGAGDVDALRRGRATMVRECTECHRMYWPDEYAPREWASITPDMADRAGLDDTEAAELLLFLRAAAEWRVPGSP